jgi:adenylate cyclase
LKAKLILKRGNVELREIPLEKDTFLIGRALGCDLEILDSMVSRKHGKVVRRDGEYWVVDLGSSNGTCLNGRRIREEKLSDLDVIKIGNTYLEFRAPSGVPAAERSRVRISSPEVPIPSLAEDTGKAKPVAEISPEYTVSLTPAEGQRSIVEQIRRQERKPEERAKEGTNFFILFQLAKAIALARDLDEILENAMDMIFSVLKAERGVIMLLDSETGELRPKVIQDRSGKAEKEINISSTITNRVIRDKVAMLTDDAMLDPRFQKGLSVMMLNIRSAICSPLWDEEGVSGLIYIDNLATTYAFTEDDRDLLTAVANQIAIAIRQEELREKVQHEAIIRSNLERYHSPDVVNLILRSGEILGLEVRASEVTVLFIDIQGFSKLSERLPARDIANLLNNYFEICTRIIFEHKGTVNKFIGDAVMAIFGAPIAHENDARLAIEASLSILKNLNDLQETLPEDQRFNVRIGINTGEVVAGNIGCAQRMEYTVIGDAVNTASRLEKVAPLNSIVIGEETAKRVSGLFGLRDLGCRRMRGMDKEISIYEVQSPA